MSNRYRYHDRESKDENEGELEDKDAKPELRRRNGRGGVVNSKM
jgi:hypothetical protein